MNMIIQQYNDIYNKIDNKILRPISFNDIQELYSFLYCYLFDNRAKNKKVYAARYNVDGLISDSEIKNIGIFNMTTIKVYLSGISSYDDGNAFYIDIRHRYMFYVNNDRSIYAFTRYGVVNRSVCIIKGDRWPRII